MTSAMTATKETNVTLPPPMVGGWVSGFARTDQPVVYVDNCVAIHENGTENATLVGTEQNVGTYVLAACEANISGAFTLSQKSFELVKPLQGITSSAAPRDLINLTGRRASTPAIEAFGSLILTHVDLFSSFGGLTSGITDVGQPASNVVGMPRTATPNMEQMSHNLSQLSSAAAAIIPGLRDMTSAECANLRAYYRKRRSR